MTRSSIQYVLKYCTESTKNRKPRKLPNSGAGPYEIIRNRQKSNGTFFKDLIQLGDVFCLSGSDDLRLALYEGFKRQLAKFAQTLSSSTKSIRCLPSGLMSFSTKAMTISIPFDSWRAMAVWKKDTKKNNTNYE